MGWYAAEDLSGAPYDFSTPVTASFTLYARWGAVPAISYIGAEGAEINNFTDYTPLESNYTALPAGSYFVEDNVNVLGRITISGEVSFILGDGATLTASKGIAVNDGNTLNIFCQSAGTGALTATAEDNDAGIGADYGQSVSGTVRIYGGEITATGSASGAGIGGANAGSNGAVYIYGGTVTANAGKTQSGSSYCAAIGGGQFGKGGIISILGGNVKANGGNNPAISTGIGYQNSSFEKTAAITLGWTKDSDSIYATNYSGSVTIVEGQTLTDGNANYRNTIETPSDLDGKTLVCAVPHTITTVYYGYGSVTAPEQACRIDTVTLTVTPNEGCVLISLNCVTEDGEDVEISENDGVYSFVMPDANVTVEIVMACIAAAISFLAVRTKTTLSTPARFELKTPCRLRRVRF